MNGASRDDPTARKPPSSPAAEIQRLMRAGLFADALPLAEKAVADVSVCLPEHAALASALLRLGRAREADEVIACAVALAGGSAESYDGLAFVSVELGAHERANALYRRATELRPDSPRHWYNLAASERGFGRLTAAEEACECCLRLDGGQAPCHLLRSQLRVQTVESNHIDELRQRLAHPRLNVPARIYFGYALAKELDDLQRCDEAFQAFAAAGRLRRSQLRYDIADDERRLERLAAVFAQVQSQLLGGGAEGSTRERVGVAGAAGARGAGYVDTAANIFIVGLPRSGTTLVERVLTGLSDVRSNGETENFSRALTAVAVAESASGDMFERAAAANPARVGAQYERLARPNGWAGALVEKLPTNYLYLGAIRRALPAAKIVLVRRAPIDSCFAMYRTLFGDAYPFSYDFEELARYYAAYDRLMAHWRAQFGAAIHEVVYEDLVRDPQRVGSELARFCGLAWSPSAIDVAGNPSVSLTASAAQVRRPIYGSSSGLWRRYRAQLEPLIAALRCLGVALPHDAQ